MGFLGAFSIRVFGWLICLCMTFGVVCGAVDCGWLKLNLLIDVSGVLVLDDGGVAEVGVGEV